MKRTVMSEAQIRNRRAFVSRVVVLGFGRESYLLGLAVVLDSCLAPVVVAASKLGSWVRRGENGVIA